MKKLPKDVQAALEVILPQKLWEARKTIQGYLKQNKGKSQKIQTKLNQNQNAKDTLVRGLARAEIKRLNIVDWHYEVQEGGEGSVIGIIPPSSPRIVIENRDCLNAARRFIDLTKNLQYMKLRKEQAALKIKSRQLEKERQQIFERMGTEGPPCHPLNRHQQPRPRGADSLETARCPRCARSYRPGCRWG